MNLEYSRTYSKAFTHTVSDYFQRVMELEANQVPHEMIYVDEAGFNLAKRHRRGRKNNWQKGHSYRAGPERSQHHHVRRNLHQWCTPEKCVIGPYNTNRLLLFLEDLHERLVPEVERGQVGDLSIYVITWDNVAFHHSCAVTAWFDAHPRMMSLFVALNPLSSTPLRSFSQPGDGRFLTIVHRTKCPSWMQWMLHAKTSQLNTARGG